MRELFGKSSGGEKNDGFEFSTIEQISETKIINTDIITTASEEIDINDI
jgi:hypothetical protein